MAGNMQNSDRQQGSRWRIAIWTIALLIPLVPLVAMQFSEEWNWGLFDFVFAYVLLIGTGLTYEFLAKKANNITYKAGVAIAVVAALLLVWINAAVGIIGDDESINIFYVGVLVVGMTGAFLARFEPQGMARTSFAMAITQMLIPVIALAIPGLRDSLMAPPGIAGVFALNAFFALLFVGAALLFRKAAQESYPTGAGHAG